LARGGAFDLWPLECRFSVASCRPANLLALGTIANCVALSVRFVRCARFHNQASRYCVACFCPRGKCDRKSCRPAPPGPYRGAVVSASQRSPSGNSPQRSEWKGASRVVRAVRARPWTLLHISHRRTANREPDRNRGDKKAVHGAVAADRSSVFLLTASYRWLQVWHGYLPSLPASNNTGQGSILWFRADDRIRQRGPLAEKGVAPSAVSMPAKVSMPTAAAPTPRSRRVSGRRDVESS